MNQPATVLSNEQIIADLQSLLGREQVLHKMIDIAARAGDASLYRLIPRVVVKPRDVADVKRILAYCRESGLYLTFRAAGTSLSGQAVTDGILVDVATHWKGMQVLDGGRIVAVQPGVVGAHVNARLVEHGAKIGPDPASINAAMMGGIAANNASGMCCDVVRNSYHTLASLKLVLADGLELDTADPDADEMFHRERPRLFAGIEAIRDEIRGNAELTERIRQKYSIKNTCGLSMNAFADFDRPSEILAHLLIGSEGTLGFISEVRLHTVPDKPLKATALVYFEHFLDAHRSVKPLADDGAAVLEIMDAAAMRSVEREMQYGFAVEDDHAALLIEFQEETEPDLAARLERAADILGGVQMVRPPEFTRDPKLRDFYWHMRKGLFPSVGAMREMGTAVIIEDVCVRPEQLADCVVDLHGLFRKYAFPDTIIFGHAKAGNLHFVICKDFSKEEEVRRYDEMMDDLMGMIVGKYDGSLKAEHGTGRNVAPYVELEWGPKIYKLMWRVKRLLDPDNILNPGVVLNTDPDVHLRHLKVMPTVSPTVDKCIECGFCEPNCPSRDLTLTPRQRIALLREMARLKAVGDAPSLAQSARLWDEYQYHGLATCATDSMCAAACPVEIDTGTMVKQLRAEDHSAWSKRMALWVVRHFGTVAWGARFGLQALHFTGRPGIAVARVFAGALNKLSGGQLPGLPADMPLPAAAPGLPKTGNSKNGHNREVVYFPSCLTRTMGALPGEKPPVGVAEALVAVLNACGWTARIPAGVSACCCGQPFGSKGFVDAATESARRTVDLLWEATRGGELPVVCETSPCSGQLQFSGKALTCADHEKWSKMRVLDFPTFMAREVLPTRVAWPKLDRHVVLHPTCTLIKIGGSDDLQKLASTFAAKVTVPLMAGCCGFAGDRGFLHPELTRSATRQEGAEAASAQNGDTLYYSTCRTCEIGMTAAVKEVYRSIVYLCYDALVGSTSASEAP